MEVSSAVPIFNQKDMVYKTLLVLIVLESIAHLKLQSSIFQDLHVIEYSLFFFPTCHLFCSGYNFMRFPKQLMTDPFARYMAEFSYSFPDCPLKIY